MTENVPLSNFIDETPSGLKLNERLLQAYIQNSLERELDECVQQANKELDRINKRWASKIRESQAEQIRKVGSNLRKKYLSKREALKSYQANKKPGDKPNEGYYTAYKEAQRAVDKHEVSSKPFWKTYYRAQKENTEEIKRKVVEHEQDIEVIKKKWIKLERELRNQITTRINGEVEHKQRILKETRDQLSDLTRELSQHISFLPPSIQDDFYRQAMEGMKVGEPFEVNLWGLEYRFSQTGVLYSIKSDQADRSFPWSQFAGKEIPLQCIKPDLYAKYGLNPRVDPMGYLDLDPFVIVYQGTKKRIEAIFDNTSDYHLIGDQREDFEMSDELTGITPEIRRERELTWHHHKSGIKTQLVPKDIHGIGHYGGSFIIKEGRTIIPNYE